ncbi:MAG: hypothetical protein Q4A52_02450 [Bacillota bacterium]|nr:hypothetical protein [Bacillota bacterium]
MKHQKEKIERFSKAVHIVIKIAFVVCVVAAVIQIMSWAVYTWDLPYFLEIGGTRVMLPVILNHEITIGNWNTIIPNFLQANLLGIIQTTVLLIILSFTEKVFVLLKNDGTPFREPVVKALKKTAIALLVLGCVTGLIGLIAAGVVYVLSLVFDYGCTLQNESDTTL